MILFYSDIEKIYYDFLKISFQLHFACFINENTKYSNSKKYPDCNLDFFGILKWFRCK